jgi:glycosyltransferase involved in cell wall biosynthesis
MKRILVITYAYAQPFRVGGAIRIKKFVRYLPEFGWRPAVLTAPSQLPDATAQQEHVSFFSATPRIEIRGHPVLSSYAWLLAATRRAVQITKREHVDVLFANCPSFAASLVAVNTARQCGAPVVADFRDAWSFNPYGQRPRFVSRIMESYVLGRIQLLITTSPGTTEEYVKRYPFLDSRIHTLYNGFDEEDFSSKRLPPFEQFTIVSAGAFYASRQPTLLFEAMRRLSDGQIRLVVMGTPDTRVLKEATKYGIGDSVEFLGVLGQREAIRQMCRAHMLLLVQGSTNMRCTPIAGKTFEYIRTGRPILAIVPEGNNAAFLREHARQAHVITSYSVDEVVEAIEWDYQEWQAGNLVALRNEEWEARWNRRELARQLGELLEHVSSNQVRTPA